MVRHADDTLHAVCPGTQRWPLHDLASTRAIEAAALSAGSPHGLMQRAGLAVARLAVATQPLARRVHALAGPGNNGGDALVAATRLQALGWEARATLFGDPARLPDDARHAFDTAVAAGVPVGSTWPESDDDDLLIDGLLGIGASRPAQGAIADAIRRVNRSGHPVIAIDLPSGLAADTGVALGGLAVRASETLSLLTLKPGLFTAQGRDHAGRVWLDTLGVEAASSPMHLLGREAWAAGPHDAHKGRFGDVGVIGGAQGMLGAVWLAARAGLAAGAGRVYVGALGDERLLGDPLRLELMQRAVPSLLDPRTLSTQTIVCGCGGGDAVRACLPALLAHAARLVLDADALNAVAADAPLMQALRSRTARGRPTMLTPHPLEAARLLGSDAAAVQANRLDSARTLAGRTGAIVVLKGSGTVVARPEGALAVNPTGNALLASPGTGDVLAGWIGGAWSRAGPDADPFTVAGASVWRHGRAADALAQGRPPPTSLPAGDLLDAMRTRVD